MAVNIKINLRTKSQFYHCGLTDSQLIDVSDGRFK